MPEYYGESRRIKVPQKFYGRTDYSTDRSALCLEIRETFWSPDQYCPNTDGPDLLGVIAKAVDAQTEMASLQESHSNLLRIAQCVCEWGKVNEERGHKMTTPEKILVADARAAVAQVTGNPKKQE